MKTDRELALMFKALAAPTRITMVRMLKKRALCVGALARLLEITPGAVSQHLGVLKEVRLVEGEKRGYFMHYRLNPETLALWQEALGDFLSAPKELEPCVFLKPGEGLCAPVKPNVKNPRS